MTHFLNYHLYRSLNFSYCVLGLYEACVHSKNPISPKTNSIESSLKSTHFTDHHIFGEIQKGAWNKSILAAMVLSTNEEDYDHMVHPDCMWKQY